MEEEGVKRRLFGCIAMAMIVLPREVTVSDNSEAINIFLASLLVACGKVLSWRQPAYACA
jgi:hypothetical protein